MNQTTQFDIKWPTDEEQKQIRKMIPNGKSFMCWDEITDTEIRFKLGVFRKTKDNLIQADYYGYKPDWEDVETLTLKREKETD